jgi:protein O-GlcNAc transferase
MAKHDKIPQLLTKAYGLHQSGRINDARGLYQSILAADPRNADALFLLGTIHLQRGYAEEGLRLITLSLEIDPINATAHYNRASALRTLKRYGEALESYDRALALSPRDSETLNNRGLTLHDLKRYEEGLQSCQRALECNPLNTQAYNNMGSCLRKLSRDSEALACFDKAITISPDNPVAYLNRGNALIKLMRYEEVPACYNKAIALNPDYAEAYHDRGRFYRQVKMHDVTLADYQRAMQIKPDIPYLFSDSLFHRLQLCMWQDVDAAFDRLAKEIEEGKPVEPFPLFATPLSDSLQRKNAETYVQEQHPPNAVHLWKGERYAHDKIRLGYFSADFHDHACSFLLAGLYELHDRSKFEVTAFSLGQASDSAMRKRLEKGFDKFIDVSMMSDFDVATMARGMEIDIAVDLAGFTRNTRLGIFALRPAPVQAGYMGFAGTMAASYIDYLIADAIVIPEEHKKYYTEKVVWLADTYFGNDSTKKISDKTFTRNEVGLPEEGFVFCGFNSTHKITPDVFDIWMRLLHKVEGSVLWLFESNTIAADNLRKEAQARGISDNRLVFAPHMPLDEHLARHRLADLYLDTFYHNAHTTMSDALWAGLPAITRCGEKFASRVAASLLNAIELPELITYSHADYEALALELALKPQKLSAIRQKLAQNRTTTPLFDTALFTRNIESAYIKMLEESSGRELESIKK